MDTMENTGMGPVPIPTPMPPPPLPPVEYAGFWKRLVAILIDQIIVGIGVGIFSAILSAGITDPVNARAFDPAFGLGSVVISWLYYSLQESSKRQATLGKMAIGIKVTDYENRRISFARATGRYFSKILSGLILMIGYIMAAFTARKQALHDMIASTLVVKK